MAIKLITRVFLESFYTLANRLAEVPQVCSRIQCDSNTLATPCVSSNLITVLCHRPENCTYTSPNHSKCKNELPVFLLSNVRPLLPKLDERATLLKNNHIDMAFITETWLTDRVGDEAVGINGFSLIRRDRHLKTRGGVFSDDSIESLWLHVKPHKLPRGVSSIIVCIIYHPPSNDPNALIDHISAGLNLFFIKHPHAGVLLVGDFNRCPISRLCRRFNLKQSVKNHTRGKAILDYVLTIFSAYYDVPQILPPLGSSDHNVIICKPTNPKPANDVKKGLIRNRNESANNAFGRWLSNVNWNSLYHSTSCEDKLNILHNILGMELFFPPKPVKIHNRDKPWITGKFKKLIEDRQKAFHQGNDSLYKQLRNAANREASKLRSSYLERKLNHLESNPNPKKWWDSVKD